MSRFMGVWLHGLGCGVLVGGIIMSWTIDAKIKESVGGVFERANARVDEHQSEMLKQVEGFKEVADVYRDHNIELLAVIMRHGLPVPTMRQLKGK